ncbi:hypothetical protein ABS432_000147 [Salmonella enterica subsp. enterica]|uniref:hypothetical protein n=1 Tax=Salmonella enterica TaxID=28901 RepID=UPI001286388C|nr:hypothetical protein [Salmonella enterica]EAO1505894.1 hypothetical protein [Salmonella enterica subsp. enterica serovar Bere]EDT0673985.1 hypothetical protein [Salmonella enterica subsp. enterica]EEJ2508055.1 hypothetical protein [Salmonella enterica subsp. arizonae serovar 47:z4,z23:-]EHJ5081622.1 hypothetical protein [Salmonella enterica subsp. enterica serovar 47:z4,z23:-]EAO6015467.1 hypothetical protein [Salmonella enterica subsp. enterica serovar Bere]
MKYFEKEEKRFKSINKTGVSSLRGVQLSDLAVHRQTRYLLGAPAKSGAGISLLIDFIDDTKARLRFFCVVRSATSQWWAGRGRCKARRC